MISTIRKQIDRKLSEFRLAEAELKKRAREMVVAENHVVDAEQAFAIVQRVTQDIQEQVHERISSIVSRCLAGVFDDPYEFKIKFERKRGQTEAELQLVRGGLVLSDPSNSAGGGAVELAAFALRLACLVLECPVRRRLMVLDEPFTRVRGKQNKKRVRAMIEALTQDFGIQFVLCIDHEAYPEFLLGHVVEVG